VQHFADELAFDVDAHLAAQFFNFDRIANRLCIYSGDHAVRPLIDHELPWTVILLLGAHSKKHIFLNGKLPDLTAYSRDLNIFKDRLKRHMKGDGFLDARNEAFTNDLSTSMMDRIRSSYSSSIGRRNAWPRTPLFVKHARTWLKHSDFNPIPCDKEGAYCMVRNTDLDALLSEALTFPHYEFVDGDTISNSVLSDIVSIAKKFDNADKSCICRSLRVAPSKVITPLRYTIKTHKPAGGVKLRLLHGAANHPFGGAGAVINNIIQPYLDNYPHICKSSRVMKERLTGSDYSATATMFKADIDNFYMEATHNVLIDCALRDLPIEASLRSALSDLLHHVLFYQYVRDTRTGNTFQILKGAGMGMSFSGALADKCYLELCERPWLLRPNVMAAFGVQRYVRYRDDSIFIVSHPRTVEPDSVIKAMNNPDYCVGYRRKWRTWTDGDRYLFGAKRCMRGQYTIKVEEIGRSLRILDMMVTLRNGHAFFAPHLKAVDRPFLACTSSHPFHTHKSWPLSNLKRLLSLSGCTHTYESVKANIMKRYCSDNVLPLAVARCLSLQYSSPIPSVQFLSDHAPTESRRGVELWGSLRYHPILDVARLSSTIGAVLLRWGFTTRDINVRITNRCAGANLGTLLIKDGERGR